jgi:hypothetical protein
MISRVRRWLLPGLCWVGTALGAAAPPPAAAQPVPRVSVQPGQVWTLSARTADGERFLTALHLDAAPGTGMPLAFHADRGVLLLDSARGTLIALDLLDARQGGLGLACVVEGTLDAPELSGVLASGSLQALPARLEAALAVGAVTRTPADRAAALQELGLGTCTLTHTP